MKTNASHQWVSDLIGDQYKNWNGKKILLSAGTGQGKTQFALKVYCGWLQKNNKKVLYICNRTKLRDQISQDVTNYNLDNVKVTTYQAISERIEQETPFNFDVFILDEAHSLLTETTYNFTTDIIYDFLLQQDTVMYMSGTANHIFEFLRRDIPSELLEEYIYKSDYSHIKCVAWYENHKDIRYILEHIRNSKKKKKKTVCFINDLERIKELSEFVEDLGETVSVYASDYNSNTWVKKKTTKTLNDSFDADVLFSTSALDNGVSLKDENIGFIIVDIRDLETAIQCIGRKRPLSDNDTVVIFIRDWKRNLYNKEISGIKAEITIAEKCQSGEKITRMEQEMSKKILFYGYDGQKATLNVNKLRYEKLSHDLKLMEMIEEDETTYKKEFLKYIGKEKDKNFQRSLKKAQDKEKNEGIIGWVKNHVGNPLSLEEERELKEMTGKKQISKIRTFIKDQTKDDQQYDLQSQVFYIQGKSERRWIINLQNRIKSA